MIITKPDYKDMTMVAMMTLIFTLHTQSRLYTIEEELPHPMSGSNPLHNRLSAPLGLCPAPPHGV